MKVEYIEMRELTDSREIMQQKSPKSIRIFISIISALFIIAIIWSMIGKIDNYVKATGEIRPANDINTITSIITGKIKGKLFEDNSYVEKGDVIISLDCNYYISQKNLLEEQKAKNLSDIENYKKLISAIEKEENLFDKETNSAFYLEYEKFISEQNSSLNQINTENGQMNFSLTEIEKSISESKASISKLNITVSEYQKLYNAIEKDKSFSSDTVSIQQTYDNYVLSYKKAESVFEQCKLTYEALKMQPNSTETQVQQALQTMEAAQVDIELVKSNMLITINDCISSLKQEIKSHESNIENCNQKKASMNYTDTKEATKQAIKNSYYINIRNTLASIEQENLSLVGQILEIEQSINNAEIKAEQSGTLLYNGDYNLGDTINAGTVLASIVPKSDELIVTLYIPEYCIADVKINQTVEYIFDSIPSVDFGKVHGKINEISADSFLNETNGQKFYKVLASVDKTTLTNNNGQVKELKAGMLVEAHAITGNQTIFAWLLDKLNFN